MMLSDFFVFVFLFDLVGDRTDVSVLGGQLCARTLGWKRGEIERTFVRFDIKFIKLLTILLCTE